jgi:hypothetical protein
MKNSLRARLFLVAVAALLVSGCFTGHGGRSQGRTGLAVDLDTILNSLVNDRRTWVDPVSEY